MPGPSGGCILTLSLVGMARCRPRRAALSGATLGKAQAMGWRPDSAPASVFTWLRRDKERGAVTSQRDVPTFLKVSVKHPLRLAWAGEANQGQRALPQECQREEPFPQARRRGGIRVWNRPLGWVQSRGFIAGFIPPAAPDCVDARIPAGGPDGSPLGSFPRTTRETRARDRALPMPKPPHHWRRDARSR